MAYLTLRKKNPEMNINKNVNDFIIFDIQPLDVISTFDVRINSYFNIGFENRETIFFLP